MGCPPSNLPDGLRSLNGGTPSFSYNVRDKHVSMF